MTAATTGYTLVEEPLRIDALDANGVAICGAYQPAGHDYWCLFVTRTVTEVTGLTVPPHRETFWGKTGRTAAKAWIELIACLTTMAMEGRS
jgi:hypothetical protein